MNKTAESIVGVTKAMAIKKEQSFEAQYCLPSFRVEAASCLERMYKGVQQYRAVGG